MRSLHARPATTIIVGLLIAAACTSASTPAPDATPAASPSITITPAAASPTAAATPASPSPTATPQPTPEPTPVSVPPKPTGVTFDQQVLDDGHFATVTQTVTWGAPRSEGVEIRVYGVTECIAEPADPLPGTGGPCLVVHTPLPASVRTLLATGPASDGVVGWTWTGGGGNCDIGYPAWGPDGTPYYAIVLAAYSAGGHSIFAIAEPGGWNRPAPGEIIC